MEETGVAGVAGEVWVEVETRKQGVGHCHGFRSTELSVRLLRTRFCRYELSLVSGFPKACESNQEKAWYDRTCIAFPRV